MEQPIQSSGGKQAAANQAKLRRLTLDIDSNIFFTQNVSMDALESQKRTASLSHLILRQTMCSQNLSLDALEAFRKP